MSAEQARQSIGTTLVVALRRAAIAVYAALVDAQYVYPSRINWLDILADLRAVGITGYRVAALMGIEWSTVQGWLNGSEPRHSYGEALLDLHRRYCGAEATKKRQSEAKVTL